MKTLALLATAALALAAPSLSRAATIQTSSAAFQAALGATPTQTTSQLGTLFAPISTVVLGNGARIGLSGSADTIDEADFGVIPYADGYTGQIVDSTTDSETLTFSRPFRFLGITISPDVGLFGTSPVSFAVSLSDGTKTTVSGAYGAGAVQFIGFTGGLETSLTVTATGAPDFSFGEFVTEVPEPASLALLATGLLALPRRRRAAPADR